MTYEYLCKACSHRFEVDHKVDAPKPGYCPECGVIGEVERQISKSSFVLKGGGWASGGYGA